MAPVDLPLGGQYRSDDTQNGALGRLRRAAAVFEGDTQTPPPAWAVARGIPGRAIDGNKKK